MIDQNFYNADAAIEGDTVIVGSTKVARACRRAASAGPIIRSSIYGTKTASPPRHSAATISG